MANDLVDKPVGFVKKHKTGVLAGAGILVIFVLYLVMRGSSGSSSSSSQPTGAATTDPNATGFSPANGLVQGPPGTAGPPGPTGSRGPSGPSGKFSFWKEARAILIARGNRHPTQSQIDRERAVIMKKTPSAGNGGGKHIPAAAPVSPAVNLAANTTHYTVKPGDTAASIAAKHGTDVSGFHGANRTTLGRKDVMAGQRVRVR